MITTNLNLCSTTKRALGFLTTTERQMHAWLPRLFAVSLLATMAGCAKPSVDVEVLPPRTSVTCSAPTAKDPAVSRGLLDVDATASGHGGYLADLRLSLAGADAVVDGVKLAYAVDGDLLSDVDVSSVGGNLVLRGKDDDVRNGALQNVQLMSRDGAKALRADNGITDVEFATVTITITPEITDGDAVGNSSTFALDVCAGCLVGPPSTSICPNGSVDVAVCRRGQDVPSFACQGG